MGLGQRLLDNFWLAPTLHEMRQKEALLTRPTLPPPWLRWNVSPFWSTRQDNNLACCVLGSSSILLLTLKRRQCNNIGIGYIESSDPLGKRKLVIEYEAISRRFESPYSCGCLCPKSVPKAVVGVLLQLQ